MSSIVLYESNEFWLTVSLRHQLGNGIAASVRLLPHYRKKNIALAFCEYLRYLVRRLANSAQIAYFVCRYTLLGTHIGM